MQCPEQILALGKGLVGMSSQTLVPLVRKIILGAAGASLDVAGAAVLPGAWPILKAAMEPVLERLKERLGGEVTASVQSAQKAAAEFEADGHLQELLRSRLLERLDALLASGERIEGDVQRLALVVTGNQELLADIKTHLESGVDLSEEAVARLADAVEQRAENSRRVREMALREMGPLGELLRRQLHRLQTRAVELVQEGALDRALDELTEGVVLVSALLQEAPTDITLRLHLGFLEKTVAQVLEAAGQPEDAQAYLRRAEDLFRFVMDDVRGDAKTAQDVANAVHGLGNVDHQRGAYAAAIDKYRLATTLNPAHAYAWHDLFAAHVELARTGRADLAEMRHALERLREIGQGLPGLGAQHIARLEEYLRRLEAGTGLASAPSDPAPPPARPRATDIRVEPELLVVVLSEAAPRLAAFNLNCVVANGSDRAVRIRSLSAEVTTPAGRTVEFAWRLFYAFQPARLAEESVMRGTGDPHEVTVPAAGAVSLGVQFAGQETDPTQLWVPGGYHVVLEAAAGTDDEQEELLLLATFHAELEPYEAGQVAFWSSASAADWDRLQDPDRAVGLRMTIDAASIAALPMRGAGAAHSPAGASEAAGDAD